MVEGVTTVNELEHDVGDGVVVMVVGIVVRSFVCWLVA